MISLFRLSLKSLRNRQMTTALTVISIALSLFLLLAVERMKRAAEDGFTQTVSQVDLIVGARSSPLQLVLYTVFNMGNATNNVSWETYEHFKNHPAVDWTIPYSLGDGHRGFRMVATTEDFFKYYHFRGDRGIELAQGQAFHDLWDVVLGSDVAESLGYKLGQKVVIAHGVTRGQGILNHEDKPFHVVGIMKPTGTPLDRSLYFSLEAMEAIHMDWQSGAMPTPGHSIPQNQIKKENIKIGTVTSFFLRTKSRIETLRLQREINDYKEEPLLAVIPGVVLGELWRGLSYVEQILKVISMMIVMVGFMAMLISLMTTLNERRREMAILRALGTQPGQLRILLISESFLLSSSGIILGLGLTIIVFGVLKPLIEQEFGLYLEGSIFSWTEFFYLSGTLVLGTFVGLIPAQKAISTALKDGLSLKL